MGKSFYAVIRILFCVVQKCVNCSSKIEDTAQLAERMKLHLRVKLQRMTIQLFRVHEFGDSESFCFRSRVFQV